MRNIQGKEEHVEHHHQSANNTIQTNEPFLQLTDCTEKKGGQKEKGERGKEGEGDMERNAVMGRELSDVSVIAIYVSYFNLYHLKNPEEEIKRRSRKI